MLRTLLFFSLHLILFFFLVFQRIAQLPTPLNRFALVRIIDIATSRRNGRAERSRERHRRRFPRNSAGRFFQTLKDAPEELNRLLDLLEHMELMLDNIGKLVEPDSDISPGVLKAIQTCEKALNKLSTLIQKVKRDSSAQSPLKKSLGFFKLACKKEEVEEIERQLDRAVSNLNMVMTYNSLHFSPSTVLKQK
jgi:hypothetical protein